MLFAAVTLGFFVENTRQHFIEEKRGQIYARRLLEDLKEDSVRLDQVYNSSKVKVDRISSIMPFLADEKKMQQNQQINPNK